MELALAKDSKVVTPIPRSLLQLDADSDYHFSRAIGQMLGFALYKKVIANKITTVQVKRFFRRNHSSTQALWNDIVWLYNLMQN
jgi:hypothetical protein